MSEVVCGDCGAPMRLKDSRFGRFYGCTRWPDCDGTHGAHPDGSPFGTPADKATRAARMAAHVAFDSLWHYDKMTRKEAYRWLRETMGKSRRTGHISRFNAEECQQLIGLIAEQSRRDRE